jgi:hypothetical protein
MHIANRCAPRKIANGAENLILQTLGHSLRVVANGAENLILQTLGHSLRVALSYMPFPWKPNSKLLVTIKPEDSSNSCVSVILQYQ